MDKFEYKVRAEEIKSLIAKGDYAQAAEIADTIDWRRVKSVMMLCTVSDLYKINKRYEDAKELLLLAYDRHPGGRTICFSLCELSIKMEEFVDAVEFYKEFVQISPNDTGKYILQYKLYEAQDVSLEERISVLEELKKRDYREKWAYELAYLYHRVGLSGRCVEACDELILWFGDGKYVIKAMELKMLHQPLTPQQQQKYDYRFEPRYDEVAKEEPVVSEAAGQTENVPEEEGIAKQDAPEYDIQVKTVDVSQYNTINLQKELAEGLREVLEEETDQEIVEETEEEVSYPQRQERNQFEDSLSMEPDGQIRFVVPQEEELDKQITGQLSIDDVMKEWERLKKEAELGYDIPDEVEEITEVEDAVEMEEATEIEEAEEEAIVEIEETFEAAVTEQETVMKKETVTQKETVAQKPAAEAGKPRVRNLSQEEKVLFGSFVHSRSAKAALAAMLDKISMASYTGNVILTAEEGVDTLTFAQNIIRNLQMTDSNFSGKTAKISGQAMNKKDITVILDQLKNGALIVQKVSGMDEKTANTLYRRLQRESDGILIVIEDSKKNMHRFLERNKCLEECFNAKMHLEALSNDALVAWGKKYAGEMEYSIDDLGVLALHTRIEELQTIDHAVTIAEVKGIIDEAIENANRKNVRHLFELLCGKRYDDEDMIILRENDFI